MFELELEKFIQSHANWRELLQQPPYNITIKDDGEYTLLKYNQIAYSCRIPPIAFHLYIVRL